MTAGFSMRPSGEQVLLMGSWHQLGGRRLEAVTLSALIFLLPHLRAGPIGASSVS